MTKYCLAADIGGTTVKCGLFDEALTLLRRWSFPTCTEADGKKILPELADSIRTVLAEEKIEKEALCGIGIGVPGIAHEGRVRMAVNLHWKDVAVAEEMTRMTGMAAFVENDANMAALGEMVKGSAGGYRNVLFITLGTGIGGGVIVDGKILAGAHGAAGEPGHIHVDDQIEEYCNCGKRGCLEQFASATAVHRMALDELKAHPHEATLLSSNELSAKDVFDACARNDALATRVVDRMTHYLGMGIANMAAMTDPEIIVIGGGVSDAGETLLQPLREKYRAMAFAGVSETPIVLATLGNDAGMYGAAALVWQQ